MSASLGFFGTIIKITYEKNVYIPKTIFEFSIFLHYHIVSLWIRQGKIAAANAAATTVTYFLRKDLQSVH